MAAQRRERQRLGRRRVGACDEHRSTTTVITAAAAAAAAAAVVRRERGRDVHAEDLVLGILQGPLVVRHAPVAHDVHPAAAGRPWPRAPDQHVRHVPHDPLEAVVGIHHRVAAGGDGAGGSAGGSW